MDTYSLTHNILGTCIHTHTHTHYLSLSLSLSLCSVMWQYLEHLSVYLKNLGQVLKAVAPAESQKVREGFARSTTTVPGTRKPKGMSKTAMRTTPSASTLQNVQFVTTKDGHLLPGEQSRCHSLLMPNTRWQRTTLALHSMKIKIFYCMIYIPR